MRVIRRVGIATGSVVIAYLALSLIAGALFGPRWSSQPFLALAVLLFGGLIYADIVRRERPT